MDLLRWSAVALIVSGLWFSPLAAQGDRDSDLQTQIIAASPGDVIDIPAGVYRGALLINKAVHLRGARLPDGTLPVLDGEGEGTILTITASGATVENFLIRNSGTVIDREDGAIVVDKASDVRLIGNRLENVLYGVRGIQANRLQIIDNYISGMDLHIARRGDGIRLWQSEACLVERNRVEQVRDAIFWFSDNSVVRGNHFRDSRYGVHMMYTDGMIIENNYLKGNSVGAYLMYSTNVRVTGNTFRLNRGPSGYGLALKDMDGVTVSDNYYIDNRVGLFFDNSPSRIDVTQEVVRNALAFNDIGVLMMPAVKRNQLHDNIFLDNLEQVGVKGGGSNPRDELGDNGWNGNFWSDYVGYDAAGDGMGDLAHRADSLFENLTDRYPSLGLLHFSPAQEAIDLAARAFPVIKPKPKLTDATPRVTPLLPVVAPVLEEIPNGMGWLSIVLLAGALTLFWRELTQPFIKQPLVPHPPAALPAAPVCKEAVQRVSNGVAIQDRHEIREGSSMITVRNLVKRYPQPGRPWWSDATITAVKDLSFELEAGQSMALWGVNGAGKTTVLKCLLGLLRCEGDLWLNGLDLQRNGRAARRQLGYVPQELAFHNDLTVIESCRFYARLKRVPLSRVPVVLAQVALVGQERKAVGALSGGMKQRLALALALLADPDVLLLDEPTSNLDADTREEFLDLLAQLRTAGKTLLFTSHHPEEVEHLAQRVLVLRDGQLVADGAPRELLSSQSPKQDRVSAAGEVKEWDGTAVNGVHREASSPSAGFETVGFSGGTDT